MNEELKTLLREILENTHTTIRSGKSEAYKVAAWMRDVGGPKIQAFLDKPESTCEEVVPGKFGWILTPQPGPYPEGHPCWWFQQLPEPIRSQAIANFDQQYYESSICEVLSLYFALAHGFCWVKTKEGHYYWENIWKRAKDGEFDKITKL